MKFIHLAEVHSISQEVNKVVLHMSSLSYEEKIEELELLCKYLDRLKELKGMYASG